VFLSALKGFETIMTAVDLIREILHLVAGTLVWPVLIGLLGLAAATLLTLGGFAREVWDRRRGRYRQLNRDQACLDKVQAVESPEEYALRLEQVFQESERRRWRAINQLRLAVRVGPALGLMGTLIPMANALQGLADGNLPALASNMVTAFAATVIGLAISVTAYLVSSVRENWVRTDVAHLAFHAERLSRLTAADEVEHVA
jgi:biopolymer transport protein ExbB/TolQ